MTDPSALWQSDTNFNGGWAYSLDHQQVCKIIERQDLWGETTYCIWLPAKNKVEKAPASRLRPISGELATSAHQIAYVSAAARVG